MTEPLPDIVQAIIYRGTDVGPEFLLLKRSAERGGFWTAVNGTRESGESVADCRTRELKEETGIDSVSKWSSELHRFTFEHNGRSLTVAVFAGEVLPETKVTLNDEHTDYRWCTPEEASRLLKFDDDKTALQRAVALLFTKN